jgi:hypothetical protein
MKRAIKLYFVAFDKISTIEHTLLVCVLSKLHRNLAGQTLSYGFNVNRWYVFLAHHSYLASVISKLEVGGPGTPKGPQTVTLHRR